jgi:translation initiation factor 5A
MAALKDLKKGQYVVIDGEPCRVVKVDISKSGKHGASKARLEAIGLFDDKKRSLVKPADSDLEIPIIMKKTAQVLAFLGPDTVQLMDLQDYSTFESEIPEELKGKMAQGGEVLYWEVSGKKILKENKSS